MKAFGGETKVCSPLLFFVQPGQKTPLRKDKKQKQKKKQKQNIDQGGEGERRPGFSGELGTFLPDIQSIFVPFLFLSTIDAFFRTSVNSRPLGSEMLLFLPAPPLVGCGHTQMSACLPRLASVSRPNVFICEPANV